MQDPEPNQNTIKERATTITSFTLVLLGLWINAINTIKINEFEIATTLKITSLTITYCLTMSVITGLTTLSTTTFLHQTTTTQ